MKRASYRRWAMTSLVLLVAALMAGGALFYRSQARALRREAEADLLTIARLKVDQIVAWRAERLGDGAVLAEDPWAGGRAVQWLSDPAGGQAGQIQRRLAALKKHYHYQSVQLVDAAGRVRLSTGHDSPTLDPETLESLERAWSTGSPMLVDLHEGPPEEAPHTEVIAPLFAGDGAARAPAGAYILQSDAGQFLYPLIQSWPRASRSAETLLVRRDGDHVLFLNNPRFMPGAALKLRIPLSQRDLPAVMAVQGQEGIVNGVDYRGVPVLAALREVPDSPWFMVAKIDEREALAVWRLRSALILALMLGLTAAAIGAGGIVWEGSQRAHYQALFKAETALRAVEARDRATLLSVGEGVIVADRQGVVELMNPVAERLTGWIGGEAIGRPVGEVLNLVDEGVSRTVTDPVLKVLRGEAAVDRVEHMLLTSREGHEVSIAASFAPIHAERGGLGGVVVVFRDQTEERLSRRFTETRLSLIEFAANHALDELLVRAIDEVAAFAESPIGFFHFVEADQVTLSLQEWSSRTTQEFCKAEGRGLHYDLDRAGVWVDCVRARKAVVHNDYASLPHKRGLPEGHAPVVRELVAPVLRDDKVVAILGVGNKPHDYTENDVQIVSYLADVTWQIVEQKRAEETIRRMAYHDALTGLPNRLLFNDRLALAMPNARRRREGLALMIMDLDGFKEINDTLGHDRGDELLRLAAARLRHLVREDDTVARIGGDEFVLLLPGVVSPDDAARAAEKIVRGFDGGFVVDGAEVRVTASVGIALYPEDGEDGPTLIRNADRAMYRAKRAGRGTYRRHAPQG